jgi:hypothetical protein
MSHDATAARVAPMMLRNACNLGVIQGARASANATNRRRTPVLPAAALRKLVDVHWLKPDPT